MSGIEDFRSLFYSQRYLRQSAGGKSRTQKENFHVKKSSCITNKRLFIVFCYLTLLLVVAAFGSIVASTFGTTTAAGKAVSAQVLAANESTAMISMLFIVLAVAFGIAVYRKNVSVGVATIAGIIGIVIIVAIGLLWHPVALTYNVWMWLVGAYILVASVTPVWILLQPRDYLSSFLLYFMVIVSIVGIVGSVLSGNGSFAMPAFTGFAAPASNGLFTTGTLFPALFVTIACGAISGFHSLVSSGTTSKQISSEKDARPIGYGAMLIECVVAVVSLCAIAFVWKDKSSATPLLTSPTAVFASGISRMIGTFVGADSPVVSVAYNMLVLAVVRCVKPAACRRRASCGMYMARQNGQEQQDVNAVTSALAYFRILISGGAMLPGVRIFCSYHCRSGLCVEDLGRRGTCGNAGHCCIGARVADLLRMRNM